jgi:hypothetical protein
MMELQEFIANETEQILLAVAKKAGWTDIKVWNPSAIRKSFVGVNLAHPELGVHIPDYTQSLDAIAWVFRKQLNIFYEVAWMPTANCARANAVTGLRVDAKTEALALCKLLLAINPDPIAPLLKEEPIAVIDDGGIG